ncbi:hypothetical protein [Streptomyces boninensis]|uniref:hypothetical protein n=1 Tax=Streptomyces boninensis TaxID=2039455 RepID=UPI003B21E72E
MALETGKAASEPAAAQPDGGGRCSLELLVHGVGGTTPEEMLDDPRTVLITGDHTAGIHRRAVDEKAEEEGRDAGTPVPEAYCWSNLTSGNGARALWLVLLPFMVINLAHWVRPAAPAKSAAQRCYDVAVRLLALSLTVQFVAAAVEVTVDLMAYQCAGSAHCVAGKSWLSFMSAESGGWWGEPGRRLAVGALVPALIAGLLWWLSHRTWSAYESASPPPRTGPATPEKDGERPVLSLPGFWYGRRLVARLRAAHTAAALLIIASALLAATVEPDTGTLAALGWVLIALTAAGWAAVLYVVCRRGRSEAELDDGDDRWAVRWLPLAALAVLAATLVHTAWSRPGWVADGRLPGTSFFGGVAIAQGALIAVLAVAAYRLQRHAEGRAPVLGGQAGPVVALLAGALSWVYSGGLAQRMGDWLDRGATPGDPGTIPGPPVVLSWQATVIPLILAVLVLVAIGAGLRLVRVKRKVTGEIPGLYPDDAEKKRLNAPRSRAIAGAVARADLTDAAPAMLAVLAVVNLILSGGAVAGAWATDQVPGQAAMDAPGLIPGFAATGQALGSWFVGALLILLLTTGRRAYKDASARRTIGILWDVGTFWPRAAHPFAPPCYAERAVPDLTWRMCTWTDRHPKGRLVLSGHSQGSVLSAAAIWQLDPGVRKKVALLTYGSPLTRLYGHWFPAYFGSAQLTALHKDLDTWRNLYRPTDPIGGRICLENGEETDDIDRPALRDPVSYGRTPDHPLPAPINGHSDYQSDPAFAEERTWLLKRLAGGKTVPAQPGKSSG